METGGKLSGWVKKTGKGKGKKDWKGKKKDQGLLLGKTVLSTGSQFLEAFCK